MGIPIEFNPSLALRKYKTTDRHKEECIPEDLEAGKDYSFLKEGQRFFWLKGEIPLLETKGNQQVSRPLASIRILEATHFILNGEVYTAGKYLVNEVYNPEDPTIHFEGLEKISTK